MARNRQLRADRDAELEWAKAHPLPRAIKRLYWQSIEVVLALRAPGEGPTSASAKGTLGAITTGVQGSRDTDGSQARGVIWMVDTEAEVDELRKEGVTWIRKTLKKVRRMQKEQPSV